MTRNEVLKILAICKEVGVQFTNSNNEILVEIWMKSFCNNTYKEVSKALFELINSRKGLFLNGLIGEIKEQLVSDKMNFLDFAAVWDMIRKAAHNTYPDVPERTEDAFCSLPPIVQYLVGSAKHLEEMEYCIDRDVLETVEKSNMRKMYCDLVQTTKNRMILGKKASWQMLTDRSSEQIDSAVKKLLQDHSF